MHLAQLNIAESRFPMSDKRMDSFTLKIDAINALADRAEGFVWRLKDNDPNIDGALSLRLPEADTALVNMSVWKNLKSLYDFVYMTAHAKIMQANQDNFHILKANHFVLWWIDVGHIPSLMEAKQRLDNIRKNGPTKTAFTFKTAFDMTGQPLTNAYKSGETL